MQAHARRGAARRGAARRSSRETAVLTINRLAAVRGCVGRLRAVLCAISCKIYFQIPKFHSKLYNIRKNKLFFGGSQNGPEPHNA
jgi:hypothetical protein